MLSYKKRIMAAGKCSTWNWLPMVHLAFPNFFYDSATARTTFRLGDHWSYLFRGCDRSDSSDSSDSDTTAAISTNRTSSSNRIK